MHFFGSVSMLRSRASFLKIVRASVLPLGEFVPAPHVCEGCLYLPPLLHIVLFPFCRLASISIQSCTLSHPSAHTCTSFLTLLSSSSSLRSSTPYSFDSDTIRTTTTCNTHSTTTIYRNQSSIMPPNQSGSAVPGPHNTPNLRQAPVKYTPKHGPRTVGSNKKYGVRSGKPDPALKDLPPLPLFAGPVIDDASHGQISPSADNLPPLPASPGPAADNDCPSYGGMTTFERMLKIGRAHV